MIVFVRPWTGRGISLWLYMNTLNINNIEVYDCACQTLDWKRNIYTALSMSPSTSCKDLTQTVVSSLCVYLRQTVVSSLCVSDTDCGKLSLSPQTTYTCVLSSLIHISCYIMCKFYTLFLLWLFGPEWQVLINLESLFNGSFDLV